MFDQDAYDELCAYTLSLRDPDFIHQNVVDAYAAQHAGPGTKAIGLTFALVGLYLSVERSWTGRQVQRAHMQLARRKGRWPTFVLPHTRGSMTALDVMRAPEGRDRDEAIRRWCRSVWGAYAESRDAVVTFLRQQDVGCEVQGGKE